MKIFISPLFGLLCLLLAAGFSLGQASQQPPIVDSNDFAKLTPQQQLDVVLAVLDARDAALRNFDITIEQRSLNHTKIGDSTRFMYKAATEIRRLDDKFWMNSSESDFYRDDDTIRDKYTANFDGNVSIRLALPPYSGIACPKGQVMPGEIASFQQCRAISLLGVKMRVFPRSFSVAEWLRNARAAKAVITCKVEDINAASVLHVGVDENGWHKDLTLDPSRGFMITELNQDYRDGAMTNQLTVVESAHTAGVWFPAKAVGKADTYASAEFTQTQYTFAKIAIGSTSDADVNITFPPNTKVVDAVKNIDYTILSNGEYSLHPITDPQAKIVNVPTVSDLVKVIDDRTALLYTRVPIVNYERPAVESMWQWVCRSFLVTLSLSAFFAFVWRARNRRNAMRTL